MQIDLLSRYSAKMQPGTPFVSHALEKKMLNIAIRNLR
jgi:hypothetical protein